MDMPDMPKLRTSRARALIIYWTVIGLWVASTSYFVWTFFPKK